MGQADLSFMEDFVSSLKQKLNKCLEPTLRCQQTAIRAHSVQNSRTLDLIQENNKVFRMGIKISATGPSVAMEKIGRNQASTFTGFCATHDASIFRPIDTQDIDTGNPEHLFLLAYRSVTREYHTLLEGAMRMQKLLHKAVDEGRVSPNEPSFVMIKATEELMKCYSFYKYRLENFDVNYVHGIFDKIKSDIILYDDQQATIAASTFYSMAPLMSEPFTGIILNAIPLPHRNMAVVISYAEVDQKSARLSLDRVLSSSGYLQKYEISKVLIAHTENFFLNPAYVSAWSSAKKEAITKAFESTINASSDIGDNPDFMLF